MSYHAVICCVVLCELMQSIQRTPAHRPEHAHECLRVVRMGVEWVSLTMATMPSHGHSTTTASVSTTVPTSAVTATATLNGTATSGDSISPSASVFAQDVAGANAFSSVAPDVALSADSVSVSLSGSAAAGATQVQNSGGSQSHYNVMPYQTVSWAIAMQGVFPSRS